MKVISLIISLFLVTAAKADVQWNIRDSNYEPAKLSKLKAFSIEGNLLYLFIDSDYLIITDQELKRAGLSKKEMMDLIKEYEASNEMTLYFNANIIPDTDNAISLARLFMSPKIN